MLFSELAEYFQKIESENLRNRKTEILSEILKRVSLEEVDLVVYLALGGLRPEFDRLEFNLAEKLIIRAVGVTLEEYKKEGDLGEVVQRRSEVARRKIDDNLSVGEVYEELVRIAKENGTGSQERKVGALARLIERVLPISAKYIVRMVAGKLRLGFSDKTILDALSYYESGNKDHSAALDLAYQRRPDVGALAKAVKMVGAAKAVEAVDVTIGVPILSALAQRLKTADEMIEKMGMVLVEPKFDGSRCVGGNTGLFVKGRGYISVRELMVGDEVLTHGGVYKRVIAKTRRGRRIGERVYKLQSYFGDALRISEGHPVLVLNNEKLLWKNVEDVNEDWLYFPRPDFGSGEVVPEEIEFVDKAGYSKTVRLNEDVFQLLGFWVGDGLSNNSHQMERIGIVCNAKQTERIKHFENVITKELHIKEIRHDKRHGADIIYWRDPVMRKWLCDNFRGKKESGKKIPEWFYGLDNKRWKAFLLGWKQADGSDKHSGYSIVTKERQMAMMGMLMNMRHGLMTGIRRIRNKAQNGKYRTYYELIVPGSNLHWREYKNGYLVKINYKRQLIKDVSHRLSLYDIQVDRDESFCVSMGTLHNCQIHFSRKEREIESKPQEGLFAEEKKGFWVKSFTRNLDESTAQFPEILQIEGQIKADEVILDSEAVGYDPKTGEMMPFQMTITRKRKHGVAEASSSVPLRFYVFDIMYLDGKSLLHLPLKERREILKRVIGGGEVLQIDEAIETNDPEELRAYHKQKLEEGLEGVLVKQVDGEYMPGRTGFNWVKFKEVEDSEAKLADTIDAVVMGYYRGKGKRSGFGLGAFLIGVRREQEIVTIAKVGTGITDLEFAELYEKLQKLEVKEQPIEYQVEKTLMPDVWVTPQLVVEVAADEITVSPTHTAGYALRFPRLIRIRTDKGVAESTSWEELKSIGRGV